MGIRYMEISWLGKGEILGGSFCPVFALSPAQWASGL